METIKIHVTDPFLGCQIGKRNLKVHDKNNCAGEFCCIHNPSDHPLKNAELNWRADRRIMERLCEHGVGHTDPDDLQYRINVLGQDPKYAGSHGCCEESCCSQAPRCYK